ncbi:MAG: hypothetical protein PHQ86_08225, partial [Dehalococcoidales bacterium]|nr:hypothetical protein [Dehalococcoidales bacterium]
MNILLLIFLNIGFRPNSTSFFTDTMYIAQNLGVGTLATNRGAQGTASSIITLEADQNSTYPCFELVGRNRSTGLNETEGQIMFIVKDTNVVAVYHPTIFIEAGEAQNDWHDVANLNYYFQSIPGSNDWYQTVQMQHDGRLGIGCNTNANTVRAIIEIDTCYYAVPPNFLRGSPSVFGNLLRWNNMAYTDTATTGSSTNELFTAFGFNKITLKAKNSTVVTDSAVGLRVDAPIAGTNMSITHSYAIASYGDILLKGNMWGGGTTRVYPLQYAYADTLVGNTVVSGGRLEMSGTAAIAGGTRVTQIGLQVGNISGVTSGYSIQTAGNITLSDNTPIASGFYT